jgi:hypothetical protein
MGENYRHGRPVRGQNRQDGVRRGVGGRT